MSEEIPEVKTCMFCGAVTHRKIYKSGNAEKLTQWLLRDWCANRDCIKKGRKYGLARGGKKLGPKGSNVIGQREWKDTSTIHYFIGSL